MDALSHSILTAATCTKASTASTVVGLVIFLAVVGTVVVLAVLNARSRKDLAAANAELSYLRPENVRLQQWLSSYTGVPATPLPTRDTPVESSVPAGWYPDPTGGHDFRYWTGTQWTADISDRGSASSDPPQVGH